MLRTKFNSDTMCGFAIKLLLVLLIVLGISGCSVGYVTRAGWEEAKILWRRQPLDMLIQNQDTDPQLRQKFELVLAAREYGKGKGLNVGRSFTSYSIVDESAVTWVITAAPKFELTPMTWWFPIVGRIPYKGHFSKEDALAEAARLKAKGFDTHVRGSAAFSTLGWFNDPLLSTTLKHEESDLIDTVIHELLHNTIWIPNNVAFNETLANVVGGIGSYQFFRETEGLSSPRTIRAADGLVRELSYGCQLKLLRTKLTALYDGGTKSEVEKLRIISEWIDALPPALTELKTVFQANRDRINNAVLIGEILYRKEMDRFLALFATLNWDLKEFVASMVKLRTAVVEEGKDPFETLEKMTVQSKLDSTAATKIASAESEPTCDNATTNPKIFNTLSLFDPPAIAPASEQLR